MYISPNLKVSTIGIDYLYGLCYIDSARSEEALSTKENDNVQIHSEHKEGYEVGEG
jgi:hypothetical protein